MLCKFDSNSNSNSNVLGIFIDLSKAFDTIDHSTLLTKLDRYGIRGNANCLIKSYLSNRTQYTEVLNEKSENLIIKYGVPQGSVLGPLLFLLYINDIANSSDLGTFILFADDTNIFIDGKTVEEAYEKGNKLLSCIKKYMILNKLHINMSKCCYMHFKPKASKPVELPDSLQLHIDGFPIKKTKATKFLGVVIDEQLSWGPHITALKRKLNYASATLNRIRELRTLYRRNSINTSTTHYLNPTLHIVSQFGVMQHSLGQQVSGCLRSTAYGSSLVIKRHT